jgi:hypothetical protein
LQDLAAHCLDGRLPEGSAAGMDDEIIERCWRCAALTLDGADAADVPFRTPDVLPVDDYGAQRVPAGLWAQGLPRPKALLVYGER